ncbi:MAG: hypothetical protein ACM3NV_06365 [Syntrophothermus sp.]
MQRQMLESKIHRATVTACDLDHGEADLERHSRLVGPVDDQNRPAAVDDHPEVPRR